MAYIAENEAKAEPLTINGLALAMGVTGIGGLKELEGVEKLAWIVRVLRAYIVHRYEQRLASRVPAGAQFALRNIDGWKDTQELEVSGRLDLATLLEEARRMRTGVPLESRAERGGIPGRVLPSKERL